MIIPSRDRILAIASRHGASRLRVFGSAARGDMTPESDLDLLVDLAPGRDLLDLIALRDELEALLSRPVDVVTERGLSPYLRTRILAHAQPL